jgi:hypothetical protein
MTNSNPGLVYDQQPTAGEWNSYFSDKQDYSPVLDAVIAQGAPVAYTNPTNWTPTDASGASLTFSGVLTRCQIIGNMAFVSVALTYPSTANGAAAIIGGLPFPVPNHTYAQCPAPVYGGTSAATIIVPIKNTSTAEFFTAATGASVVNSALSTATLTFQLIYPLT